MLDGLYLKILIAQPFIQHWNRIDCKQFRMAVRTEVKRPQISAYLPRKKMKTNHKRELYIL